MSTQFVKPSSCWQTTTVSESAFSIWGVVLNGPVSQDMTLIPPMKNGLKVNLVEKEITIADYNEVLRKFFNDTNIPLDINELNKYFEHLCKKISPFKTLYCTK